MSERESVLRVLQVHTRYRQAGGEDQVVEAERQLLEGAGIDVHQVIFDNAELRESRSLAGDLGLAASAIWSRSAQRRIRAAIVANRPQVMHVHNTFPAASPSVYSAAAPRGVAVIQTLHNYRLVCPAATLFRDGHVCTECVGRPMPWPAVVHACVRDSRSQSLVAAATITAQRARARFTQGIDVYIALTHFQRELMIEGGLPAERIRVIPNFLASDPQTGSEGRTGVLFAGRLSDEKGIAVLLEAASMVPGMVSVAGGGPLSNTVKQAEAAGHLTSLGSLPQASVVVEIRRAIALVVPSIWFEGFPIVLLEAFATGTPVIASRIGSLAELVEHGVTGLLVEPGNAAYLADQIRWARDHPSEMREMGVHARDRFESLFGGEAHLAALLETYRSIVQ